MPLNKEQLFAHLKASRGKSPASPAKPSSIKAAEKIEQDVKKATGVSKVERDVTDHTNNLELPQVESPQDARAIAEASLSKALMKKLLDGSKLTSEEQKLVAVVCKQVGLL